MIYFSFTFFRSVLIVCILQLVENHLTEDQRRIQDFGREVQMKIRRVCLPNLTQNLLKFHMKMK